MIANVVIGGLIFGYAGWAMVRHVRKAREGKCAACSIRESCHSSGCDNK